ncbi:hypothetical protein SDC9_117367 [bioreactor metagenome]|uniref:Uncharacterized protein n=1 Tax=bioreactor metagenome TaxID=1076179 RepID=A0A645BYK5_9ZZZZ
MRGHRAHQHHIGRLGRLGHQFGAGAAALAGLVLHLDRAQLCARFLGDQACRCVQRAACGVGHHQRHRRGRILGVGCHGHASQQKTEQTRSAEQHGVLKKVNIRAVYLQFIAVQHC